MSSQARSSLVLPLVEVAAAVPAGNGAGGALERPEGVVGAAELPAPAGPGQLVDVHRVDAGGEALLGVAAVGQQRGRGHRVAPGEDAGTVVRAGPVGEEA